MAGYLTGFAGNISTYFTPRKPSFRKTLPSLTKVEFHRQNEVHELPEDTDATLIGEEWLSSTKTADFDGLEQSTPINSNAVLKKHPRAQSQGNASKRRKTGDDAYREQDEEADSNSDFEGTTLIASPGPSWSRTTTPTVKAIQNRSRMPPPPRSGRAEDKFYVPDPQLVDKDLDHKHRIVRADFQDPDLSDEELWTERTRVRKSDRREIGYDFDHERARRQADAIELPTDSGHWSNTEKDLFFRLAMRGFEPLVPGNWTLDFKTLPISLFSVEGGENPIVEPQGTSQFRAIHYLESLFSIGQKVRDRHIMCLRSEPIMRRLLVHYIEWALDDAKVHPRQRPHSLPVYTIATRRQGEKTQQTLDRMTRKLYSLASRYHELHGVYPSIERDDSRDDSTQKVTSISDGTEDDPRFPVLTGFLICSSLMVVVTLNTNPLHFRMNPQYLPRRPTSAGFIPEGRLETASKEDSGLRFIATFDFSEQGMDVWNGSAIAIVVMRIRKSVREMLGTAEEQPEATDKDNNSGTQVDDDEDL